MNNNDEVNKKEAVKKRLEQEAIDKASNFRKKTQHPLPLPEAGKWTRHYRGKIQETAEKAKESLERLKTEGASNFNDWIASMVLIWKAMFDQIKAGEPRNFVKYRGWIVNGKHFFHGWGRERDVVQRFFSKRDILLEPVIAEDGSIGFNLAHRGEKVTNDEARQATSALKSNLAESYAMIVNELNKDGVKATYDEKTNKVTLTQNDVPMNADNVTKFIRDNQKDMGVAIDKLYKYYVNANLHDIDVPPPISSL